MEDHAKQAKIPPQVPSKETLDQLSAEELAVALEATLDEMTEDSYDKSVINAYLEALDRKAPISDPPDSNKAYQDFQAMLSSALPKQAYDEHKTSDRPKVVLRNTLRVILVAACLFGCLIVAQAAGIDVFGAVARWTEKTFQFSVSENETATVWFADHQEELDAVGLSEELLPAWIPEGYSLESFQVSELSTRTDIYATFSNAEHLTFDILITTYKNSENIELRIFEKSDNLVSTLQVNDKTIYLFDNLGLINAVCQYESEIYSLTGDITQEVIISLFGSIGDG